MWVLGLVLLELTNDFVVKQQKENKHVENIYWFLSWETEQQEVGIQKSINHILWK